MISKITEEIFKLKILHFSSRLLDPHKQIQSWKGRSKIQKTGLRPKNQRELQEIQHWLVLRLGRVEKQLQVLEMMVFHKGLHLCFGFRIFVLKCLWIIVFICYQLYSICFCCYFASYFLIASFMVNSAESGSEGSSDASDENNQQVCIYASVSFVFMCDLYLTLNG